MSNSPSLRFFTALLLLTLAAGSFTDANDAFITIGGGPEPSSNQVSLESNVRFFQRTLQTALTEKPAHDLYFADGDIAKRDLQYVDPNVTLTPGARWLIDLFGQTDQATMAYRDTDLPGVTGPTRKAVLRQRFYELADTLGRGDRLFIYVTAHGGPATSESDYYEYDPEYYEVPPTDENRFNTTITLWNNEDLPAAEFSTWLNDFDPEVTVVMVMAQCYAGGFARTIFQHADPAAGLVNAKRCGFFSQRYNAPSTGCTALVDESTYRDYSTYFWEAIGGRSRTGEPVGSCDFNGDGLVSFNEAHAHAMIVADSMDVPVLTSDVLLRRYSRIAEITPAEPVEESTEKEPGFFASLFGAEKEEPKPPRPVELTETLRSRDQTIDQCTAMARPPQAAVITALSDVLKIDGSTTVSDVQKRSRSIKKRFDTAQQNWINQLTVNSTGLEEIRNAVMRQYPELQYGTLHPLMTKLMVPSAESDQFVAFINDYPITANYVEGVAKAERLRAKAEAMENRHAKSVRLRRTLETVLLGANLPQVASPQRVKAVEQLILLESVSLTP